MSAREDILAKVGRRKRLAVDAKPPIAADAADDQDLYARFAALAPGVRCHPRR